MIDTSTKQLGMDVRQFRNDIGLSKDEFAQLLAIPAEQLEAFERGEGRLLTVTLARLCGALVGEILKRLFTPDRTPST